MGKVVNLTVHKNTREKRKRRECHTNLVTCARRCPKDMDGWAFVAFRRSGTNLDVIVHYDTTNPTDIVQLPNLAQHEIRSKIDRNAQIS